MSVFGQTASNIDAVVLDVPTLDVDGLLGQSFLDHFVYRIDKSHPDRLILSPRTRK